MFIESVRSRSRLWPEAGNSHFVNNQTRVKRLWLSPVGGYSLLADVSWPNKLDSSGDKPALLKFSKLQQAKDSPLLDSLSMTPGNQGALTHACRSQNGLIISNKSEDSFALDGAAILTSLRPDVLVVDKCSGSEDLAELLALSENHLVVLGQSGIDPVELMSHVEGMFQDAVSLLPKFHNRLLLSFVSHWIPRVCGSCARSTQADPRTVERIPELLHAKTPEKYMFGRGCARCGHSAYLGQVALESLVYVDDNIRSLLIKSATPAQIAGVSYRKGARSLLEDGLEKIKNGFASFESVLGVTSNLPTAFEAAIASENDAAESPAEKEISARLAAMDDDFLGAEEDVPVKLLVVEDDLDQREILQLVFQNEGYEVFTAQNGEEALEFLQAQAVDLLISDLMMPKMNGEQLVAEVRKDDSLSSMPILMLTVVTSDDTEYRLLNCGADDYCEKNVKRKVLLKRVERLLSRAAKNVSNPALRS